MPHCSSMTVMTGVTVLCLNPITIIIVHAQVSGCRANHITRSEINIINRLHRSVQQENTEHEQYCSFKADFNSRTGSMNSATARISL
jgi:hypothetical protein